MQIAFQGEPGAYSEAAVLEHFNSEAVVPVPCESFEQVFAAVSEGRVDYGFIPIENSLAGSIHQNYDLLLRNNLWVVGEHHLRVSHCLIGQPGA
ncbi:MAG: prephenate dehydratase domain-containing protein, partial [Anaerolineaceae bacterium]